MKDYGDRNEETVNDFLKKRHYHYDYSFLAIDSLYDLHKEPKYNNLIIPENISLDSINWSLIQVRVFNSDGSYHNSLAQCSRDFGDDKYTFEFPINKNECSFKNEKLELKNEFDLMHIDSNKSNEILSEAKKFKYVLVVLEHSNQLLFRTYFTQCFKIEKETSERSHGYLGESRQRRTEIEFL